MKEEFVRYLEGMGLTQALIGRIQEIIEFYRKVCSGDISDILVTDYISSDERREYESLWLFSEPYAMEAKDFIARDDFDMASLRDRVTRWHIRKENYDFVLASDDSRLSVHASTAEGYYCQFKAARENCDHLRDVFLKHLLPNLRE